MVFKIVVQWLKICSLNIEVKGGEVFKPSLLHPEMAGKVFKWTKFLA
jgi:hypothetical protein